MSTEQSGATETSSGGTIITNSKPTNDDDITLKKEKKKSATQTGKSSSTATRGKKRKEPSQPSQHHQQQQQPLVECMGRPKEALEAYRKLLYQYESEDRKKPDMQAFSHLKEEWTPPRKHGELRDVPIGLHLRGRGEAAILGIHCNIPRGIDALKGEPCYAICISGGYADDEDCSSADGTIYYTGEGGRKKGQHVADQVETVANTSLIRSYETGTTIRVLRGTVPNYYYLGLYRCTNYTYEPSGLHAFKVYKFQLVPIMEHQCPKARALPLFTPKIGGRSRRSNTTTTTKKKTNKKLRIRLAMPKNLAVASKNVEEVAQPKKLEEAKAIVRMKLEEDEEEDSTRMEEATLEIPLESLPPVKKLEDKEAVAPKLEEEDSEENDSMVEEPLHVPRRSLRSEAMAPVKQEEDSVVVEEPMPKISRRPLPPVAMAPVKQEEEEDSKAEEPMPLIPRRSLPNVAMVRVKQEEEEEEEDSTTMEELMPHIPRRSLPPVPDSVSSFAGMGSNTYHH